MPQDTDLPVPGFLTTTIREFSGNYSPEVGAVKREIP
jgi:hypothetical protein